MQPYTVQDCRNAQRACEALSVSSPSRAMKRYWDAIAARWRAREREIEKKSLARRPRIAAGLTDSPISERLPLIGGPSECYETSWGSDQKRCTRCGMVWDTNETKPECQLYKEL